MTRRISAALLTLVAAAAPAYALVPGPITQLTNDAADEVQPAISGNRVVWTQDTGGTTGFDIFAMVIGGGPAVDITPFDGGQFFDDIDGHFAVYVDDRGAFVTAIRYDLGNGNAVVLNDGVNASRPAIWNPGGGTDGHVAYVARAATSSVVYVPPALFPTATVPQAPGDNDDSPRIHDGWVVFQRLPSGGLLHQIVAYRVSDGALATVTDGAAGDDTSPDIDGTTVVFTRNASAILSVPVTGGATTQLSLVGAPGSRDRARISGTSVVWDDMRAGNNDIYWSASNGGGEVALRTGAGDQFLTDIDGTNVVYTDGPIGGPHDIYLLGLVQCNADTDCNAGQVCTNHSCGPKPCGSNADCSGGKVCAAGACIPCTANAQCGNGLVCQGGACTTPQCTTNAQCGTEVCVSNACVPCTSNAQCGNGLSCNGGACGTPKGCTCDAQCGKGMECDKGTCEPKGDGGCGHHGDGDDGDDGDNDGHGHHWGWHHSGCHDDGDDGGGDHDGGDRDHGWRRWLSGWGRRR